MGSEAGWKDKLAEGCMNVRTLHRASEQRTMAIVLETGDEAMACLMQVAQKEGITAAQFTAIGAFASATLG
jgi:predicted DNA-binding protein with PD1-like motif